MDLKVFFFFLCFWNYCFRFFFSIPPLGFFLFVFRIEPRRNDEWLEHTFFISACFL